MRRFVLLSLLVGGCYRNLDFAPCQEDPTQPICFDTGTTDSATTDTGVTETGSDAACTGPKSQACGKCGAQTRTCVDGAWTDWGTCSGEKECTPGETTAGTACTAVLEKATKKCNDTCTFDPQVCALPSGWTKIADPPAALGGRLYYTSNWTGGEMIVFGGGMTLDASPGMKDGAIYNLQKNAWTMLPALPTGTQGRKSHTAVWGVNELLVWGGSDDGVTLSDGVTYSGFFKTWQKLPTAPIAARQGHVAVWMSSAKKMFIWGGKDAANSALADGAEYDPDAGTWVKLPAAPMSGRHLAFAAWTGTEALVWGGESAGVSFNDGALYNPMTRTWRKIDAAPVAGRHFGAIGLTDTSLIVSGGMTLMGVRIDDTAEFTFSSTPSWKTVTAPASPLNASRLAASSWTTSDALYVWSGVTFDSALGEDTIASTGLTYSSSKLTWTAMPMALQPTPRQLAAAVSTGQCGVVWGGAGKASGGIVELLTDGGLYCP